MKKLNVILISLLLSGSAFASLRVFNSSNAQVGQFAEAKCGASMSCTKVAGKLSLEASGAFTGDVSGDGGDQLYGFLSNQVAATATTITAAQCGSTFINSGAVEMELPEASTVLGCELTFIVGHASNFTIDPDAADQIVLSTNAAGDSLIADAVGEVLKIQAISASAWAPMIQTGTWTDSN